ncbi:alginate lyase-domain-containing protein, partial [Schizophyllum fasciatum]
AGREGTFTGVLDLRGMVKIVNACMMVKAAKNPAYSPAFDRAFLQWARDYTNWLQTSGIGKKTGTRPNNHGSFFVSQLASLLLFQGDTAGAKRLLDSFFHGAFKDQIAKNGDQPFESMRTRPYHYRAFNLEALITNAKIGAELGVDYWSVPSKYGKTIQDAVDYAMNTKSGKEDVSELLPHVAAVAAAYGDAKGTRRRSLTRSKYDQPAAVSVQKSKRAAVKVVRDDGVSSGPGAVDTPPSECPAVFKLLGETEVEVDNGLFVTCEMLKPYYEVPALPSPEQ